MLCLSMMSILLLKIRNILKVFGKFLKNSSVYQNVFSVAPVTEMALPSIFSGDLPFSNGSYESGIKIKKIISLIYFIKIIMM